MKTVFNFLWNLITGGAWITLRRGPFTASAKIYPQPSQYGIGGHGRISKLTITREDGTVLLNYDRGLDINNLDGSPAALRFYQDLVRSYN